MSSLATETLASDLVQSLLDGFSDPAFLLDLDHRIRLVNRSWLRIHPQGGDVVGRRCHEVLHHEPVACTARQADCPVRECALQRRSVHALHLHHGIEGEELHHVSVHPVRLCDGEMVGFLQTFQSLHATSTVPHPHRLADPESPGNVAELLSALERTSFLADDDSIGVERIQRVRTHRDGLDPSFSQGGDEILSLAEVEERYLAWAARHFKGSRSDLAKHLGIAERTLFRKLSQLRKPVSGPRAPSRDGNPCRGQSPS